MQPGLPQRGLLVHRDDRKAAALAHPRVLDHRAAEGLDNAVQVLIARVRLVDPEALARAHDVAAVEGADPQAAQRTHHARAQLGEPDLLHQQPQEVLVRQPALVAEPLARQRLVDVLAVGRARVEALLALALGALARRADVHHQLRVLDLLREGESARVERVGELLVVLGDHAGARAAGAVELYQLDVEQRRDLRHRAVQLGREAAAHAAGPIGDLHAPALSSAPPEAIGTCSPAAPGSLVAPASPLASGASASSSLPVTYR